MHWGNKRSPGADEVDQCDESEDAERGEEQSAAMGEDARGGSLRCGD